MADSLESEDETKQLRSTLLETATSILQIRQRAEQEIRQTNEVLEQRTRELGHALMVLRATLDSTTDAILVIDEKFNLTELNEKYIDGRSSDDGTWSSLAWNEEEAALPEAGISRLRKEKSRANRRFEKLLFQLNLSPLTHIDRECRAGVFDHSAKPLQAMQRLQKGLIHPSYLAPSFRNGLKFKF